MKQLNTTETLKKYIKGVVPEHFRSEAGVEPYQYYINTSYSLKEGLIADLGTYQGLSSICLAANPKVKVVSYDIDLSFNLAEKENVTYMQGNIFDYIADIIQAEIILLDIDPHDGIQEAELIDELIEHNYKGKVICDDIHRNIGMKNWWHKVSLRKEDVTNLGHWSGTGIIYFD